MGDKSICVSDQEFFCLRSEFLTNEIILMDKENLYQDKHNSRLPRTHVPTESSNESLSYFSNNSNFLVPPFSAGPKIPEAQKTWSVPGSTQSKLSQVVGHGGSVVPSPPITPIGRNIDYQVKNMNSQGQNRNFPSINLHGALPSVHRGTVWGHQQAGGHFGNGGYEYNVTPEMAWGGPQVQNQRRSYGGVDVRAVGYGGGIKRERAGTGVFLPRRYNNTAPESRKKTGVPTTQPPQRVFQAQNNKFENVTPQLQSQRQFTGSSHISQNELVMARRNAASPQEWRKYEMMQTTTSNTTATSSEEMAMNNEIRLPQEWTY